MRLCIFVNGLARIAMVAIMLAIPLAATAQSQQSAVEESVRIVFGSFTSALLTRNGALAARYIDDATIALHEKYRQLALTGQKTSLLKERFSVIVGVLSV